MISDEMLNECKTIGDIATKLFGKNDYYKRMRTRKCMIAQRAKSR